MLRIDSINRSSKGNVGLLYGALLIGLALVVFLLLGLKLSSGSKLPLLVAVGVLALAILLPEPIRGIYVAFPLIFLVPYGVLRLNLPFFRSPLNVIVSLTLGLGIVRIVAQKRKLPKSKLYAPIVVCGAVLAVFTLIGHGEVANLRLYGFIQGLWPFALVVLLLDTPRQARNILISISGTLVVLSLLWLPGLVTGGRIGSSFIRSLAQPQTITGLSTEYALVQGIGAFTILTLLALAFVATLLFSLCVFSGRLRYSYWIGFVIVAGVILVATYAAALLAFVVGMVMVFLLGWHYKAAKGRPLIVLSLLLLAILVVVLLFYVNPQSGKTAERLLNPSLDSSASARTQAMQQGLHAFMASPIIGNGAFNREVVTRSGYYLGGHNTFIVAAYEFGLLFLVPYLWLFLRVGKGYFQLMRRVNRPIEKAIAVGMAASFGAAVVAAFITPVFGQPSQDAIIWLFIGLMTVWNNWLERDPEAELVA